MKSSPPNPTRRRDLGGIKRLIWGRTRHPITGSGCWGWDRQPRAGLEGICPHHPTQSLEDPNSFIIPWRSCLDPQPLQHPSGTSSCSWLSVMQGGKSSRMAIKLPARASPGASTHSCSPPHPAPALPRSCICTMGCGTCSGCDLWGDGANQPSP